MKDFADLDIPVLPELPDIMMNTNVKLIKEEFPYMLVEDLVTGKQFYIDWTEKILNE